MYLVKHLLRYTLLLANNVFGQTFTNTLLQIMYLVKHLLRYTLLLANNVFGQTFT